MTIASGKTFGLAAISGMALAFSAPTQAADILTATPQTQSQYSGIEVLGDMTAAHKRKHHHRHARGHAYGHRKHYDDRYDYDEPIYRDTRVWRGRDGRYYCRKEDGTTGLLIGAGVGALAGRELAGRGDRTLGTLLGAVGGALIGREIDRSNSRCR